MDKFEQAVNAAGGAAAIEADTSYYTQENPKPKIVTPMDFREEFQELISPGAAYSMPSFTAAMNGYVLGETTLIFAKSGCGKTVYSQGEVMSLINSGCPVAVVSTEETKLTLTNNMIWVATGRKLPRLSGDNEEENAANKKLRWDIIEKLYGNRMLFMPDNVQSLKLDSILAFIEQCAVDHGIKHFFIDSVTSLAGKSAASGTAPWEMLEKTVTSIADIGRRLNLSINLIGHTSVEKQSLSQYSIKGSTSLATFCDNVMVLYEAEKTPETDEGGLTTVDYRCMEILKVRVNGEYRNKIIGMAYDVSKRKLRECIDVLYDEPDDRTAPPKKKAGEVEKVKPGNFNVRVKSDDELIEMGVDGIEAYVKETKMDGKSSTNLLERHERITKREDDNNKGGF